MIVELNLVFSQNMFSPIYTLIARERIAVETGEEVLAQIVRFIGDNIGTFDAAISDKDLVNRLQTLELTTVSDFYSLKFLLAQFGLDILANQVAELEVNPADIEENQLEYNVIDMLDDAPIFTRLATKVVITQDGNDNRAELYKKVIDMFSFFRGELASGFRNPLTSTVAELERVNQAFGISPEAFTVPLNSYLEYLGKTIILIQK